LAFLEDHAVAIDLVFHEGVNHDTYNIGGFNEWQNIDLVKLLCKIMDEKLVVEVGASEQLISYVKSPGHDLRYAIDASKINTKLEAFCYFRRRIERTVTWYLENQTWLNNITSGEYATYYEKQYLWEISWIGYRLHSDE
jgi:dTDP-glucose 4,6-dehydratase